MYWIKSKPDKSIMKLGPEPAVQFSVFLSVRTCIFSFNLWFINTL